AGRDHDRGRDDDAAVDERDGEAVAVAHDRGDQRLVELGHRVALEPEPVVDEHLQRKRITRAVLRRGEEALEAVVAVGVRQVRRPPMRSQAHSLGHVCAPQLERLAECGDTQPPREEVRGGRQAVRAGPDHDDIQIVRDSRFPRGLRNDGHSTHTTPPVARLCARADGARQRWPLVLNVLRRATRAVAPASAVGGASASRSGVTSQGVGDREEAELRALLEARDLAGTATRALALYGPELYGFLINL